MDGPRSARPAPVLADLLDVAAELRIPRRAAVGGRGQRDPAAVVQNHVGDPPRNPAPRIGPHLDVIELGPRPFAAPAQNPAVNTAPITPGEITGREQEEGEEGQAAQAASSGPDPG